MHYFPTRDHLLTDVLREVDDQAEDVYSDLGDRIDAGEYLAAVMEHNAAQPARIKLYCLMVVAATEPDHPAGEYFRDRFERLRTVIVELLELQHPQGLPSGLDPEFVAASFVAAADGIQNQWLHDQTIDMGAHVRKTWQVLTE